MPAATIVPGDLVVLALGDHVPADVRLLQVSNLLVDEAVLTGEAVPVEKSADAITVDSVLGDRVCMAYAGTVVVGGKATGVVVATGTRTELGRIGKMLADVDHGETLEQPAHGRAARDSSVTRARGGVGAHFSALLHVLFCLTTAAV